MERWRKALAVRQVSFVLVAVLALSAGFGLSTHLSAVTAPQAVGPIPIAVPAAPVQLADIFAPAASRAATKSPKAPIRPPAGFLWLEPDTCDCCGGGPFLSCSVCPFIECGS
jgi:hypothetical protein